MTAYEKLKAARKSDRPTAVAYINELFDNTIELHGDRRFSDDAAIVAGIAYLDKTPITYIGIEKGHDMQSRMKRNFGCPKPEGYRKALRLMKQAEKFSRPVICFVDTLGAFCGADAEERGQGQAIAENLMEMMGLNTPIITVVIGEGGSGGALGLACANRVYMLENSVYSVISPEGCASIIWKDSEKVADAADCLHITADDMLDFGVAERVIPEDFAHFKKMCSQLKKCLVEDLDELSAVPRANLSVERYERFRKFGNYIEE
ncbi:MAG: acetyl-CoA carboxylase carboxyltransferase subunit alpha [Acutalibacteraceae bacterium]